MATLIRGLRSRVGGSRDHRVLQVSSGRHDDDKIILSIEDSGPGIDPKHVENIFDAFITTKSHGMGLGLALCRMIIERHSGELSVSPAHPRGSIFRIVLPIFAHDEKIAKTADVCFWHYADITTGLSDVRFRGVKRTSIGHAAMSAYDPKRTWTEDQRGPRRCGLTFRCGLPADLHEPATCDVCRRTTRRIAKCSGAIAPVTLTVPSRAFSIQQTRGQRGDQV